MKYYPAALGRTILLVSDEVLSIYKASSSRLVLVESVSWNEEGFVDNVANILSKDCGGKPVVVLHDMVEQHYRKESLLRKGIGKMDQSSVLNRKIQMSFPNYPARAALPLKSKSLKGKSGKASDLYILAAVPASDPFEKLLAVVKKSLVQVVGVFLLPIESSEMVSTLSLKLSKGRKDDHRWVVFIGHSQNGGVRQIVTKDGELALTRMTPVGAGLSDDEWAQAIHKEFKSTMSYLSRLEYQPEQGLRVITIANAAQGSALEALIDVDCDFNALGVHDAARVLGVKSVPSAEEHYAQTLHVGWVAKKSSFVLPLTSPPVEKIAGPRKKSLLASLLLLCGIGFLCLQFVTHFFSSTSLGSKIKEQEARKAQLTAQYQREVQKREALGFDVLLLTSSLLVHEELESDRIRPLKVFDAVGRALGRDMRVDQIYVRRAEQEKFPRRDGKKRIFDSVFQMTYPSTTDIEKGNAEIEELKARIQYLLPEHVVQITKRLKDYEYVEEIVVETGVQNVSGDDPDFIAEITIKGMANDG